MNDGRGGGGNAPPILIGTAGWSVPKAAAATFPPSGSQLERYAAVMPVVEINSSSHRPHRRSTYERWAASTPDRFRFAVKLPKEVAHIRRLVGADEPIDRFIEQAAGLGRKLAIILLQMPPSLSFDPAIAPTFLNGLKRRLGPDIAIACEPRHPSWFETAAETCLVDHGVARVAADPIPVPAGGRPGGWPGLHYYRLHGSPRTYYSAYGRDRLKALAGAMAGGGTPPATWCILNNTASGAAIEDALCLRSILHGAQLHL